MRENARSAALSGSKACGCARSGCGASCREPDGPYCWIAAKWRVDGAEVDGADAAVVGAVGGVLCFEVEGADEGEGGEVGGVVEV